MRPTTTFRERLRKGPITSPSCYDCLSARLAEAAGFEAIHLSGAGIEASLLGGPDLGLLSMSEVVAHVARVTSAVDIPVIVDIDTGFGGVLNIQRTIREMERAGAAGVHLEDQALPKPCPLLGDRRVVSRTEALDRLKAALDAKQDPDFVIIARSDADVISDQEVVERCNLFLETGADMALPIFLVTGGTSYFQLDPARQERVIRALPRQIAGPVMYMGVRPPSGMTLSDLAEAGYAFSILATSAIGAAANAMAAVFEEIRETDSDARHVRDNPGPYHDGLALMRLLNLDRFVETERKFSTSSQT